MALWAERAPSLMCSIEEGSFSWAGGVLLEDPERLVQASFLAAPIGGAQDGPRPVQDRERPLWPLRTCSNWRGYTGLPSSGFGFSLGISSIVAWPLGKRAWWWMYIVILFLPLPVLCGSLMTIASLVWFLPLSAMKSCNTTMRLWDYEDQKKQLWPHDRF